MAKPLMRFVFLAGLIVGIFSLLALSQEQAEPALFVILQGGMNGYIDRSGKIVIPPKFESWGRNFAEGRAAVGSSRKPMDAEHVKYGFVDASGKVVIPTRFDEVRDFSEGLAAVGFAVRGRREFPSMDQPRRWGYISRDGATVIPPQFTKAFDFSSGLAAVRGANRKWGYIDKTGRLVIPLQYERALSFSEGLAAVTVGERVGYINPVGKLVVPPQFADAASFSEGLARVGLETNFPRKWMAPHEYDSGNVQIGYVDATGREVIRQEAVDAGDFSEGLAWFLIENQEASPYATRPSSVTNRVGYHWCGYTDSAGKTAIPPRFQSCGDFSEGLAKVVANGKWCFINHAGQIVLSSPYRWAGDFHRGLALVEGENNVRGYIDNTGKIIFWPTPLGRR